jgi:hypothetical protein
MHCERELCVHCMLPAVPPPPMGMPPPGMMRPGMPPMPPPPGMMGMPPPGMPPVSKPERIWGSPGPVQFMSRFASSLGVSGAFPCVTGAVGFQTCRPLRACAKLNRDLEGGYLLKPTCWKHRQGLLCDLKLRPISVDSDVISGPRKS